MAAEDADTGPPADGRETGTPVPVERSPALLSAAVAVVAAAAASVLLAVSPLLLLASAVGTALVVVAVVRGSRRALVAGTGSHFAGLLLAGVYGMAPGYVLAAALLVVLAWDVGEYALTIGREVGRAPPTLRVEVVHVAGSVAVYSLAATVGYVLYRSTTGGQPMLTLVALVVGGMALLYALHSG